MAELGFPMRLRGKSNRQPCPQCEAADAATHPLVIGAVVTVLRPGGRSLVVEGVGTILRPACEPDIYFIRLRGETRIQKRLIFPDYQRDPARMIDLLNRHLERDAYEYICNSILARGEDPWR